MHQSDSSPPYSRSVNDNRGSRRLISILGARRAFPVGRSDAKGAVIGGVNSIGWLAAGVPGALAGLELALQRYGTRSLRDTLAPAIAMCESGTYAVAVKGIDDVPANLPSGAGASAGVGLPPEKQRNLALAGLLKTLAARNSTESFYRGDLAGKIADAFSGTADLSPATIWLRIARGRSHRSPSNGTGRRSTPHR